LLLPSLAWTVYESMYHVGYVLIFGAFLLVRFVLPSPPRHPTATKSVASDKGKDAATTKTKSGGGGVDQAPKNASKVKMVR
jgi:hypothetical protein